MSAAVVLVVLAAALAHATWNALAHASRDRLAGFALIGIAYAVIAGVGCFLVPLPSHEAWPFILASTVVQTLYMVLLWRSYELGDFSSVYPLARGTSPWVVAVFSAVVLGQHLPWGETLGVVLISVGLVWLTVAGGLPRRGHLRPLVAAVMTGVTIAGYTLIDGEAVHHVDAWSYIAWNFMLQGVVLAGLMLAIRGRTLLPALALTWRTGLTGGAISLVAYGAVLWAQSQSTNIAPVAALRESSIIFGALIGTLLFHERLGRWRTAASVVVALGVGMTALL